MARIHRVKKAQQRYATVPVIDPATGEQKQTPVINRRTGEQKVTKRGKPVFLKVTTRDLNQPLEMPKCDFPGCQREDRHIVVGEPYMQVTPKSGPYGGHTRYRHDEHPAWRPWDLSNSLSAQLQRVDSDYRDAVGSAENEDDVKSALESMANEVRDLAQQKEEGAENIREGFGHDTYQSEELQQQAEDLNNWADEIEQADVPALEDHPCQDCDGEGEVASEEDEDEQVPCDSCSGTGYSQEEGVVGVVSVVPVVDVCPV